ncbi:MAG TPA: phage tail sheath C-terminal domain-containing protein [Thermoanaerobaculia bacterium]|nr:phage tail sheath C-terminal domain-containing protein [Thermoanaerobaculia bacterium]
MPVTTSYPGVYLEELPSTTHSVVAAATSNAAIIDWFPQGPIDQAVQITSLNQFNAIFGGVAFGGIVEGSEGSYAVQQFFLNGGSTIWVVRVVPAGGGSPPGTPAVPAVMSLPLVASPPLSYPYASVFAVNPGSWGNNLSIGLNVQPAPNNQSPSNSQLYTLQVGSTLLPATPSSPAVLETYYNVSLNPSDPSFVASVVNGVSQYVTVTIPAAPSPLTSPPDLASPPVLPPTGSPPAPEVWTALTDGLDGNWAPDGSDFASAIEAQLVPGNSTPVPGSITPFLNLIAPQVFNILLVPAAAILLSEASQAVITAGIAYCQYNQAFFVIDPPPPSTIVQNQVQTASYPWLTSPPPPPSTQFVNPGPGDTDILAWVSSNNYVSSANYSAATYYPWLSIPDPANNFQPRLVGPSGTIAGIYASNDFNQGVWTAPAGTNAVLQGATLTTALNDADSGILNPQGINVLRSFPIYGNIVWGARTLAGADLLQSQWKYINVRRLTDFIEQSLMQSLKWAVFQPNAAPLWSSITMEVTSFLSGLFAQGAFQGTSAAQAYFVQCDGTTTTPQNILNGVVNVVVGFAPVFPAEFIILQIELMLGQPQAA